jgi:hypothetical protein
MLKSIGMDTMGTEKYKPKNPITYAKHRREVFWQITIPIILGAIVLIALAVWVSLVSFGDQVLADKWASVSLIWLIIPAMVFTLVFAVILGGLTYLVMKIIQVFPAITFKVEEFMLKVRTRARQITDAAVKPVTATKSGWAAVRVLFGKEP